MAIHVRVTIVALLFCLTSVFKILRCASNTDAKNDSYQNKSGIKSVHRMKGGWRIAGQERRRGGLRSGSTRVNDTAGGKRFQGRSYLLSVAALPDGDLFYGFQGPQTSARRLTLSVSSYAISPTGIYERKRDGLYRADFGNWLVKPQADNEKWDAVTKCEAIKPSKDIYRFTLSYSRESYPRWYIEHIAIGLYVIKIAAL